MDQFDHQSAVVVQMAIIAEERRQNVPQHAGPSSFLAPSGEERDEIRCDSAHSHLSREQPSKLPSSTSSFNTWVEEVRGKGKSTRCPSCGEGAKDCSCRRHISFFDDKVKVLKKRAKGKKRDDYSKWGEMEQRLEKLATLFEHLSVTRLTGEGYNRLSLLIALMILFCLCLCLLLLLPDVVQVFETNML